MPETMQERLRDIARASVIDDIDPDDTPQKTTVWEAADLIDSLIRERDKARARVADGIAELYSAALADHAAASYDEVGLNGVPIKVWREAYAEGCKDMAEKVAAHLGDGFKELVLQAIEKHRALLSNREG